MFRKILLISFLLYSTVDSLYAQLNFNGAEQLVQRRIPWLAGKIVFQTIEKNINPDTADVFSMQTKNDRLYIQASSVSAASMAVNYYLKQYCHQFISLQTENIDPLKKLPTISGVVKKSIPFQFRHGNYHCTLNYTQAFWQWKQWERCIDRYALNGVNLMITLVGAEGIEQEVLRIFGYTEKQIITYHFNTADK